jgi:hypothetical protein
MSKIIYRVTVSLSSPKMCVTYKSEQRQTVGKAGCKRPEWNNHSADLAKQLQFLESEWKLEHKLNRYMRFGRGSDNPYRLLVSAAFIHHAREESNSDFVCTFQRWRTRTRSAKCRWGRRRALAGVRWTHLGIWLRIANANWPKQTWKIRKRVRLVFVAAMIWPPFSAPEWPPWVHKAVYMLPECSADAEKTEVLQVSLNHTHFHCAFQPQPTQISLFSINLDLIFSRSLRCSPDVTFM